MKILIYSQYYAPEVGAAQTRLRNIVACLRERGCELRVLSAVPNYPSGKIPSAYRWRWSVSEKIDNVPVIRTAIIPVRNAGFLRLISYASFQLTSFWPLLRQCRTWKPDIVFVESPPLFLGISAVLAKRFLKQKFVFNVADLWPDWAVDMGAVKKSSASYKLAKMLELSIYRSADVISLVVPTMRAQLVEQGVASAKLVDLPNGVDVRKFEIRSSADALPDCFAGELSGKKIVLYAGTHGRYHGLTYALDAAKQLLGAPIVFVFLGDGSEKQMLVEYARTHAIDNVLFLDAVQPDEVIPFMRACDVFLSVIQIRTRAAKILPALAAGKPIVYAGEGEGADLVRAAGAGIVVDPKDSNAIAEAVQTLCLGNASGAEQMATNGRRYAVEHLDWRGFVDDWLNRVRGILEAERACVASSEGA